MIKRILAFCLSLVTQNLASYINTVRMHNFKLGWGEGGEGGRGEGCGGRGEECGYSTISACEGKGGWGQESSDYISYRVLAIQDYSFLRGKNTLQNFYQYELKALQPNMIYLILRIFPSLSF